jgi:hypothetical protein
MQNLSNSVRQVPKIVVILHFPEPPMTKINSSSVAGSLPTLTGPASTEPKPALPRPEPLPAAKPGIVDKFLTPQRSQDLANTQASQLDSIRAGVQNGSITEKEAAKLLAQQAKISEATANATADGAITGREAANIRQMQAKAGVDTFLASINGQHAPADDVAKKQAAQIGQIAQGVRSGSLNGAEANTLLADQSDIAQTAADAKADGEVDFIEKQMLNIRQEAASFEISQDKGNTEKAPHAATRLNFPVIL